MFTFLIKPDEIKEKESENATFLRRYRFLTGQVREIFKFSSGKKSIFDV